MSTTQREESLSFTCVAGIQYGEADGMPLMLDMLRPSSLPNTPRPVVMYLHGGGWNQGHRSNGLYPWCNPRLAAHGFVTVSISYRLSQRAIFPAQIYDVKAAVRWLRANADQYGIDANAIGVWGDSAGGHLASLLGVTGNVPELEGNYGSPGYSSAVQAVIARAAPSDFLHIGGQMLNDQPSPVTELFGGTLANCEAMMRLASPITHVKAAVPPFLLIHGTADETVPFEQAQRMYDALKAIHADVNLQAFEGRYHNLRTDPELSWGNDPWDELGWEALSFFQKYLTSIGTTGTARYPIR